MNTFSSGARAACHLAFLAEDPLRGGNGRCSGDAVVTHNDVAAPVVLPAAAAHPLSDRVRVLRWGTVAAANLVS